MPVVSLSRAAPGSKLGRLNYPYSTAVNEIIRNIPGREFNRTYKVWLIPTTPANVLLLKQRLAAIRWELSIPRELADDLNRAYAAEKAALAVRSAGDSDIAFDYLTEPYAHQRAGLAFLAHLDGGALLWEMGLGKTKTAIDFAEYLIRHSEVPAQDFSVLVICPNTIKRNWAAEIEKHAGHSNYVIPRGTIPQRVKQLATETYTIVNCEALSHKPMADELRSMGPWDLVIVDESTRFKTPEAARTKALMKIATKRRVILTGTPITGKPEDAYVQFEWVAPGTFGPKFWSFKERYLEKDFFGNVTGIRPGMADELRERIDAHAYRILKEDVLDLPEKVYVDRRVEMVGEQKRAYNQMRDELRIELANADEIRATNILTVLLRLTQVTAGLIGTGSKYQWLDPNAKTTELDHLLNEELAGEQVVIFGLYKAELENLAARYAGPSVGLDKWDLPPIIYGPTPEHRRQELIDQFQAGNRRLLFAQTRTGGIGINLTKAQTAIYVTRSWSLEEYLQSQDRLHRIGQTGTVSIIHLLAEDSIDQDIADALAEKRNLADHLTGDSARALAARLLGK